MEIRDTSVLLIHIFILLQLTARTQEPIEYHHQLTDYIFLNTKIAEKITRSLFVEPYSIFETSKLFIQELPQCTVLKISGFETFSNPLGLLIRLTMHDEFT